MDISAERSKKWVVLGATSGVVANLLFPVMLLVPLPNYLELFLAGAFGVLFSLMGFGVHHLMAYHNRSAFTEAGAYFIFAGGLVFNLMLMIQLTLRGNLKLLRQRMEGVNETASLDIIGEVVDLVHLGIQLSTDFFTAFGMILFSVAMLNHPLFGKRWGVPGLVLGVTLLVTKAYAFPLTPGEVGIPYVFGPLIAGWFLLVCLHCLRHQPQV